MFSKSTAFLVCTLFAFLLASSSAASKNRVRGNTISCGKKFSKYNATYELQTAVIGPLDDMRNSKDEDGHVFKYLIGVCEPLSLKLNNVPDRIAEICKDVLKKYGEVGALQYHDGDKDKSMGSVCYALAGDIGKLDNVTWNLLNTDNPALGVTLEYTGGSSKDCGKSRSISISHVCAEQLPDTPNARVLEDTDCHYQVFLEGQFGCPEECPKVQESGVFSHKRVCNHKGICRYSQKEKTPKCFCDDGYSGKDCTTEGNSNNSSHKKKSSGGAVAGGFFGGIALGVLVGGAIYAYLYIYKPKQSVPQFAGSSSTSGGAYRPPDQDEGIQGEGGGKAPLL